MTKPALLALLFLAQAACALFFAYDVFAALLNLPYQPIPWELREILEIAAAFGLMIGLVLGALTLMRAIKAKGRAEESLRRASTEFESLLQERFGEWALTPAERDVALFVVKGPAPAETARLSGAAEGTVKAQCNAVYRKAGVTGRFQLLGLFVEDLMQGVGKVVPLPTVDTSAPAQTGDATDNAGTGQDAAAESERLALR
jgi:DNA-binding CsgD family transcriptional regulator